MDNGQWQLTLLLKGELGKNNAASKKVLDPLLSNFAPTFSLIVVKVARAAAML